MENPIYKNKPNARWLSEWQAPTIVTSTSLLKRNGKKRNILLPENIELTISKWQVLCIIIMFHEKQDFINTSPPPSSSSYRMFIWLDYGWLFVTFVQYAWEQRQKTFIIRGKKCKLMLIQHGQWTFVIVVFGLNLSPGFRFVVVFW